MIIVDRNSRSSRDRINTNNKSILASTLEDISSSESDLRGYNGKTWLPSSPFNVTVSSILSHSFCPRCAYIAFKERRYIQTAQGVEGQINHFLIERFLAKETDFIQSREYGQIDYHLCLDFLETLKKNAKDRFGFLYNKLGGNFEAVWSRSEHVLKGRFVKLIFISEVAQRQFEIPLSSKHLGLAGRLDVLENGEIPVEIKTGKPPRNGYYLSHAVQVALYALLIEDKYSIDVDTGYIYYSLADERRIVNIDYNLRREALSQRDKALRTFLDGKEPEGKCERCKAAAQYNIVASCGSRQDNNNDDNNNLNKNRQEMNTSTIVMARAKGMENIY